MNLTPDQARELNRVREAGNQAEGARGALRAAVFDALDAGVPKTRVAAASGLGRMTLWRWLKDGGE